ncbi:hypothetical protein ACLB2K_058040 [Fragaria x ananassa]
MNKEMAESGSPFLFWFSFFCLLHSLPVYYSISPPPRFPSSLISPEEKVSLAARQNQLYRTKYFTQILDHFNYYPKSYDTFQQRYLINDTFWGGAKSNAPIFVYTGNEGNIEWFAQNTGFLYETAPHFKALIIFIESESESCYKVIKGSWQQIEDTANQPGGIELLRKSFRICKNHFTGYDLEGWLGTAYIYTAMTDYPTPSNFLSPMPAYPVKQMCKAIDDPATGNDTFAKLFGAATVYYNYTGTATCFDPNDNSDPHDLGGWQWQKLDRGDDDDLYIMLDHRSF